MLVETKEIFDPIHGYIKLTGLAQAIIHTQQFQRLRYLHQLGTCHYVFPCATHTRFEHSIGTYHLAGKVLDAIKKNSDNTLLEKYLGEIEELKLHFKKTGKVELDPFVIELVKIAALCHDIGHGPFSHVFDDIFMHDIGTGHELELHENRSCKIIKYIISKNPKLVEYIGLKENLEFICSLIIPVDGKHDGFIYQIVSNNLNGIDVDKFDYIQRDSYTLGLKYSIDSDRLISHMKVIDNKICFTMKVHYDIVSVFTTRYRLHKQIYSHKTVISVQYMIKDMMVILNKFINIYNSIFDIEKFTDVTEEHITTLLKLLYRDKEKYNSAEQSEIDKAYELWIRLNERNLYELVGSVVTNEKVNVQDIMKTFGSSVVCHQTKIGFVSGTKTNPLESVYFYSHKDNNNTCFKVTKNHSSYLVSNVYQEHIIMFFVKDRNDHKTKAELKIFMDSLCIDETKV